MKVTTSSITGYLPVATHTRSTPPPEVVDRFTQMVMPSLEPDLILPFRFVGLLSSPAATALGWCLVANGEWEAFEVECFEVEVTEKHRVQESGEPGS